MEAYGDAVTLRVENVAIEGQVAPTGPGQTATAGVGRGHWRTCGVPDGLGSATVWSLFQDRDGYLWLGIQSGGIRRFDGETFHAFTEQDVDVLARNVVPAIYQDREGLLWFGSYGGLVRYDGETFTTDASE